MLALLTVAAASASGLLLGTSTRPTILRAAAIDMQISDEESAFFMIIPAASRSRPSYYYCASFCITHFTHPADRAALSLRARRTCLPPCARASTTTKPRGAACRRPKDQTRWVLMRWDLLMWWTM